MAPPSEFRAIGVSRDASTWGKACRTAIGSAARRRNHAASAWAGPETLPAESVSAVKIASAIPSHNSTYIELLSQVRLLMRCAACPLGYRPAEQCRAVERSAFGFLCLGLDPALSHLLALAS